MAPQIRAYAPTTITARAHRMIRASEGLPSQPTPIMYDRLATVIAPRKASAVQTMRCSRYSFHRRTESMVETPSCRYLRAAGFIPAGFEPAGITPAARLHFALGDSGTRKTRSYLR